MRMAMTTTLGPETRKLLEDQLKKGNFASADEVVHAALRALEELNELDEETLDAIDEAEDELERGEALDWKDVRGEIRKEFLGG